MPWDLLKHPQLILPIQSDVRAGARAAAPVRGGGSSAAGTNTCDASSVEAHCLIGGPNSLGGQGRERGGQNLHLSFNFFQRRTGCLVLVLHRTQVLATGGP